MGRPKGSTGKKHRKWTVEEKVRIINRVLIDLETLDSVAKDENINGGLLHNWIKKYRDGGVEELGTDRRGRLSKFSSKKNMTREEELEYENLLLKIEIERLKKGYQVKGGGKSKEFISISNKSSKS